jgi:hypothetical protein
VRRRTERLLWALSLVAAIVAIAACVTEDADPRVTGAVPSLATFAPVSDLLDHRCGTLDCHGVTYRNLRIYGREGLRLAPDGRPSSGALPTTQAEYEATFQSLVGLEPEVMNAFLAEGGLHPERLTLVRKARGTESHKGLAIWSEGDPQDRCLTSWLKGQPDEALCRTAIAAH